MKKFEFTDNEIAAILNAVYDRYEELEGPSIENPLLNAGLRSEFDDLKSALAKLKDQH